MVIPERIRKCVFFLAIKRNDGTHRNVGSGVFIGIPSPISDTSAAYAVTAKHVIEDAQRYGSLFIRINEKDGGVRLIETDPAKWHRLDDPSVDAAAIQVIFDDNMDVRLIGLETVAGQREIEDEVVGIGDEVCIIGLFRFHPGKAKCNPIVRIGNIAAIPTEKILTQRFGPMDAYLVECRSIGGLSGSPVFAFDGLIRRAARGAEHVVVANQDFNLRLLGIIQGHWDVDASSVDTLDSGGSGGQINVGMAIITPAEKFVDLLASSAMIGERDSYFIAAAKDNLPVEDGVFDDDDDPILTAKRVFDQAVGDSKSSS